MSDHVYKSVEVTGSSPDGIQKAIDNALDKAAETLRNLDWFEVKEIRGTVKDGKPGWYQVKLGVGFRVMEPGDMQREA